MAIAVLLGSYCILPLGECDPSQHAGKLIQHALAEGWERERTRE